MRICYHCGRLTSGKPLFCNHCGRSYSVKFCPRLHPNHRSAEACSQCGSRELSIPQERLPLWLRPLMLLFGIVPGLALLLVSVLYVGYYLICLIRDPDNLLAPMLYGVALAFGWFAWLHVPLLLMRWLRRSRTGK